MTTAPNAEMSTTVSHGPDGVLETAVGTVTTAKGASPLDLRPSPGVIGPDAANELVRAGEQDIPVEFLYHGDTVRGDRDGRVATGDSDDYR